MTAGRSGANDPGARSGRGLAGFLKATLLGGAAFLLPFGLVLIVLGKLLSIVRPTGDAIRAVLMPHAASEVGATLFAVLVLVVLAFLAGLFAMSPLGARAFAALESAVLMRFPSYRLLSRTIHVQTATATDLGDGSDADGEVVFVRFDDQTSIGFVAERMSDGRVVVYLPGAPSPFSGTVVIVEESQLTASRLTVADMFGRMRRLGAGLDRMMGDR